MTSIDSTVAQADEATRDFEEALHELAVPKRPLVKAAIGFYGWPGLTLVLAMAVRIIVGPGWALLLALLVIARLVPGAIPLFMLRVRLARRWKTIDWSTAEACRRRIAVAISPEAMTALNDACELVQARLGVPRTYVYRKPPGLVSPLSRHSASVAGTLGGPPAVIIVGDLLTDSVDQLRYVLAHEVAHTTRGQRLTRAIWSVAAAWSWPLLGLLLSPTAALVTALVIQVVLTGAAWTLEILADVAAAREAGAGAADWSVVAIAAARACPLPRRVCAALMPSHPPLRLRATYTRLILVRTRAGKNPR